MDEAPATDKNIRDIPALDNPTSNTTPLTRLLEVGNMSAPKKPPYLVMQDSSPPMDPRGSPRSQLRANSELFMDPNQDDNSDEEDYEVHEILEEDVPAGVGFNPRSFTMVKYVKTEPITEKDVEGSNGTMLGNSRHDGVDSSGHTDAQSDIAARPIDLISNPKTGSYQATEIFIVSDDDGDSEDRKPIITISDDDEDDEDANPLASPVTLVNSKRHHQLGRFQKKLIKLGCRRDKLQRKPGDGVLGEEDYRLFQQLEKQIADTEKVLNASEGENYYNCSEGDDSSFSSEGDDSNFNSEGDDSNFNSEGDDSNFNSDGDDLNSFSYETRNDDNVDGQGIGDQEPSGGEYEAVDVSDDEENLRRRPCKKRKRITTKESSSKSKPKNPSAPPCKKPKIKHDKERSKEQKRARPLTAKEWWEREYERNGDSGAAPNLFDPKGSTNNKRTFTWQPDGAQDVKMLETLKGQDPVNARAAMKASTAWEDGKAQTRKAQEDQIGANLKMINDSMVRKDARQEMSLLKRAMGSFGWGKCKHRNGRYLLPKMRTSLFHHQLVGVHFMLGKEHSPLGPYGGILADQMGLGKTVQMLACIAQNPGDGGPTLIVAPAAAIDQWKSEIKKHCEHGTKVWHYSDKNPNQSPSILKAQYIVIASYQAIARAFPSEETLRRMSGSNPRSDHWRDCPRDKIGDAFLVEWNRVVLDEAHAIKNHLSRTSKACVNLRGKYRWALSGTPIHNNVGEFFPYMKFLGVEWTADMKKFKKMFGGAPGNDESEKARLAVVIPSLMIRRRVHDTFMGQPILSIPPTHPVKTIVVQLSIEEELIYKRLEARFRDNLNSHITEGVASKKMRTYFVYLTRLRQCTSHPFLLETSLRRDFELEDIVWLRQRLAEVGGQTPLHVQIMKWISGEEARRLQGDQIGGQNMTLGQVGFGRSAFGGAFEMSEQLERIQAEKTVEDLVCRACTELPQDSQITQPCGHTFCKECIEPVMKDAEASGRDAHCPCCKSVVKSYKQLQKPAETGWRYEDDTDEEIEQQVDDAARLSGKLKKNPRTKKGPQPGDDFLGLQPRSSDISKFLEICDKTPQKPVTPSAKTTVIKLLVLEWLSSYPKDKIIIFTHWVSLARILGRVFQAENVPFLYYFGSMSMLEKKNAIDCFMEINKNKEDKEVLPKLLISSTKCGGQALNLTIANHTIVVEPWWNTAVEQQAFGRVHRIGQAKETYYVKIITRNTIEERMIDMQTRKDATISETLQDKYHKPTQLDISDICSLLRGNHDDNEVDSRKSGSNPDGVLANGGKSGECEQDDSSKEDDSNNKTGGSSGRQGVKRPFGPGSDSRGGVKRVASTPKLPPKSQVWAVEDTEDLDGNQDADRSEEGLEMSQIGQALADCPENPDDSDQPRPSIEGGNEPAETNLSLADLASDFDSLTEQYERSAPNKQPFVEDTDSDPDE